MVLTEEQIFKVPFAFNSLSSFSEIISSEKNCLIIAEFEKYSATKKILLHHPQLLYNITENAKVAKTTKWHINKIIDAWILQFNKFQAKEKNG